MHSRQLQFWSFSNIFRIIVEEEDAGSSKQAWNAVVGFLESASIPPRLSHFHDKEEHEIRRKAHENVQNDHIT